MEGGRVGPSSGRTSVGIVIFDDVEVLDFCGPFEVFSVTRLDKEEGVASVSPYSVSLIAQSENPVTTVGGMRVIPDASFDSCKMLDVLLIPGGRGTRVQVNNPELVEFLAKRSTEVSLIGSVCTGALLLAGAGLLDGRHATTHWQALDLLEGMFPKVRVDRTRHFVEDGNIITSAGISAGIDMALRVVARQFGEPVAMETARQMEYPFPETDCRRIRL